MWTRFLKLLTLIPKRHRIYAVLAAAALVAMAMWVGFTVGLDGISVGTTESETIVTMEPDKEKL